jgi:hypothetical protein
MTVTLPWWTLLVIAAICGLIGWAVTEAAHAAQALASARPRQDPAGPAQPPLPRAGSLLLVTGDPYPTVPGQLTSNHHAQMDAYEREIRQLTAAAEARWPDGWWAAQR